MQVDHDFKYDEDGGNDAEDEGNNAEDEGNYAEDEGNDVGVDVEDNYGDSYWLFLPKPKFFRTQSLENASTEFH